MSAPNVIAILPIVVEIFQSLPKRWTLQYLACLKKDCMFTENKKKKMNWKQPCCWPTTIATKETVKWIIVLIARSPFGGKTVNKIKMQCELAALDHSKLKVLCCCIAVTCFMFWVSNNIFEMCMLTNRCGIVVPRRLRAVLDWWRANEDNNLSTPPLTHCPWLCLFFSFRSDECVHCRCVGVGGLKWRLIRLSACLCRGRPWPQTWMSRRFRENNQWKWGFVFISRASAGSTK